MLFSLPEPVLYAMERLEKAGFQAFAVGGCVRDHVLGLAPHDYDICTSALPEDMLSLFRDHRVIETGLKHGTLTVLTQEMPLEITTFRLDGEYLDGRHPTSVQFTTQVEEDLSRRDFTINAMAYSPLRGLVDPFGGRQDCQNRLIRCVGAPEKRFEEDGLRILRALRFSARLGFPIEEKTARAVIEERNRLQRISRERIAAELTGLLLGEQTARVLARFPQVLETAVPELAGLIHTPHWEKALDAVSLTPRDPLLRWAALLEKCAAAPREAAALARQILLGLKMPTKTIDAVSQLILWHTAPLTAGGMQEMLMHVGPERLDQLLTLGQVNQTVFGSLDAQAAARETEALRQAVKKLMDENACYTLSQLAVGGSDAAAAGLRGPAIGNALNQLLLQVTRGETPNEREALLSALQSFAPSP